MQKFIRGMVGLLIAVGCSQQVLAQTVTERQFPRFSVVQGQLDRDGLPISGAKLCLLPGRQTCFAMPSLAMSNGKDKYEFGLSPRSDRHSLAQGGSWVFVAATFSGGGSGVLTRYALLRYTATGSLQNLLPEIALADEADAALWDVPSSSAFPLVVTAEPIWDSEHGETHFQAHRQDIHVWRFEQERNTYKSILSYRTSAKHGEDGNPTNALKMERATILKRLAAN